MNSYTAREVEVASHQGAVEPFRGPAEHGDAAGQSIAVVLFLARLRAAGGAAEVGLGGTTEWAEAQVDTIRLKFLKIAAQVRVSARRIWIRYSGAPYPWQNVFAAAYTALRC